MYPLYVGLGGENGRDRKEGDTISGDAGKDPAFGGCEDSPVLDLLGKDSARSAVDTDGSSALHNKVSVKESFDALEKTNSCTNDLTSI